MQSRRDQVQAHQFVVSRLVTGLLRADPDEPETPVQRTQRGVFVGALLAIVVCVGFLVYGFAKPGGATAWRKPGTLVMEKETGTRYFYDGTLRPVRNHASARLLTAPGSVMQKVSSSSLRGTAHGAPVGIEDAPDALPAAGDLSDGPWDVCASTGRTSSGDRRPVTELFVDAERAVRGLPRDRAVLVRAGEEFHLLWRGNRYRLPGGRTAADALGYGGAQPLAVSGAFLQALPAGPDLAAPRTPGLGEDGPRLDGRPSAVGTVYGVPAPGGGQQHYLLHRAGLVPVTGTQAALLLGDPRTLRAAYGDSAAASARPLSSRALNEARAPWEGDGAAIREAGEALPQVPPALESVADGLSLCSRLSPQGERGTTVQLVFAGTRSGAAGAPAVAATRPACAPVDAVIVPAGRGGLVRVLGASGRQVGTSAYLVTDTGVKYRIAGKDAAEALGYDLATDAQAVPSTLVGMLPTGPDLSPEAAAAGRSGVTGTPHCGAPSG